MRERTYFAINEEAAKRAKSMMSFDDYKDGSQTAAYKASVDKAYELADKVAEKKPDAAEEAYRLAERYSKKLAEYYNKDNEIACRCPSIMITGGSNFPVKKKEKQNQAWERNYENYKYCESLKEKIENLLYKQQIIKSGDADAIEKLEEKLENLKKTQEMMKAANRAIRMKDTEKGNETLKAMGYTDNQIKELREPDFCGRVGYPDYALQNNNANIRRVESRIKQLKAAKDQGVTEKETDICKVVENTEEMRLQLIFDGKPEPEVREILKKNGFRWSPKNTAWQRQLTSNAKYAANRVIKEIENLTA